MSVTVIKTRYLRLKHVRFLGAAHILIDVPKNVIVTFHSVTHLPLKENVTPNLGSAGDKFPRGGDN